MLLGAGESEGRLEISTGVDVLTRHQFYQAGKVSSCLLMAARSGIPNFKSSLHAVPGRRGAGKAFFLLEKEQRI